MSDEKSLFEQHRAKMGKTLRMMRTTMGNGRSRVAATHTGAYQAVFTKYRKQADHDAQHGPVKVLWKDGKPVEPQA